MRKDAFVKSRHPGERWDPDESVGFWIPAFAVMSGVVVS
jgi:hypothetical protein